MKRHILTLIIGLIIGSCITATAAYVYRANDIGYTPVDETWNVNNVGEAITELKNDINQINTNIENYSGVSLLTDYGTTNVSEYGGTDTASVTITKAGRYRIFALLERIDNSYSGTGIKINGTQVVQSNKGGNSFYEADLEVGDVVSVYTFNPNYASGNRGAWLYVVG